ncbi:MAG: propionyl-CoA carboxylase beta chain, partial [Actinomycetota bacterium]
VPRVCVILRKAYGGAYIVMDSRGMGSDFVVAWPRAEIAVMGANQAIGLLYGRRELPQEEMERLTEAYEADYCTPRVAAERGYVDRVIEPTETRRVVVGAFDALRSKREHLPKRRHANIPQ